MSADPSVVYVVDDDASIREGLDSLLRASGYDVRSFGSTGEFLQAERLSVPACLVLDVRMPGTSGLDFQRQLAGTGDDLPIVFITAHGDIPMSVRAMKAGAFEFLPKPFSDEKLLAAVAEAIEADRRNRRAAAADLDLRRRFASLTKREKEVMAHVVQGRLNKQVAGDLGLSEVTVKLHRGNAMRKMQAGSLADLVRMAERLGDALA